MSEAEARAVLVPAAYQVAGGASAWIGALNARIDDYRDAVLREAAAKLRAAAEEECFGACCEGTDALIALIDPDVNADG